MKTWLNNPQIHALKATRALRPKLMPPWWAALLVSCAIAPAFAQSSGTASAGSSAGGTLNVTVEESVSDDATNPPPAPRPKAAGRRGARATVAGPEIRATPHVRNLNVNTGAWTGPGKSGPQTAFVQAKSMEPKVKTELAEDMAVMARILDKAAGVNDVKRVAAMNVTISVLGSAQAARNLYLDDYGLVFFVTTPVVLVAPGGEAGEKKLASTSSDWEEAKRDLEGTREPSDVWFEQENQTTEEYDAQKVEQLKNGLIEALKNATHLRHLKANDRIVVLVNSSGSAGGNQNIWVGTHGRMDLLDVNTTGGRGTGTEEKHTLTITVKKEDVDAFANGKMAAEDFRKKVTIVND